MVSLNQTTANLYDRSYYLKTNDIFREIRKYPDITFPKAQPKPDIKETPKAVESPTRQKKTNRDVSLDKHMKI